MDWLNSPNPYSGISTSHSEFPSVLPMNEASDWIADAGPSEIVLGVDGKGRSLTADIDSQSPHILISAPTGRGKSAVARNIAVQRLVKGDIVVILDIKRHSHRWARRLAPNVVYAKDLQDIGGMLVKLGREVHTRNAVVDEWEGPVSDAPVGPRIIVLFEEQNSTMTELKDLDKRLPKGDYTSARGLRDLSMMGRAIRMHLISFAQLASYRATGGADIIENYGARILIGHSPTAWRWLASDCGPAVAAPEEEGRGIVCQRGKASEAQLVWLPEDDAERCVLDAPAAQRRARELSGGRTRLPAPWREAIGR